MTHSLDLFKSLLSEKEQIGDAPSGQNTTAAPAEKVKDNFSLPKHIKTDPSKPFTQQQVAQYVQQAHDKAEEIDTVAFGLELNDGAIVKVYVNADESEGFEKAMAALLGKEDDIEDAINDLSQEFDIVSVEWPEELEAQANPGDDSDANETPPITSDEEKPLEKETKVQLGFELNKPKEEDDKDGEDDKAKDEEPKEDELDMPGEPDKDEEETEDGEDDEEEEEDTKKKGAAKKKGPPAKKVKESVSSSQWAFDAFLNEATHHEETAADQKIEDLFRTSVQRKIISLVLLLGMPAAKLTQNKSGLRHGVREAAIRLQSNPKARQFLHRSLNELEEILGVNDVEKHSSGSKNVEEAIEHGATISTAVIFEHLLELLHSLGVPADILHNKKSMIRQALRPTISKMIKHNKLRNYLGNLGKALGHTHHVSKDEEELAEEVSLGNDPYFLIVAKLAASLGIPDENLAYKKSGVIQSLRQRKETLDWTTVRPRLLNLLKLLSTPMTESLSVIEEDANRHLRDRAVSMGNWSISRTGERLRLSIDKLEIKLDTVETKRLVHTVDEGFETTVRAGDVHYNFKPVEHGKLYIVYPHGGKNEDLYAEGIIFPTESVEALLNLW